MTKNQALKYLARTLAEAITDAECDVAVFTGVEGKLGYANVPDKVQARELFEALDALGFDEAAMIVHQEAELSEAESQ